MDDFTDTHLCLVCQATLIGLENYIIHKRNACPAGKQASDGAKIAPSHVMAGPPDGNAMLGSHNYQHQDVRPAESGRHFGHSLQTQSAANHSHPPVSSYVSLRTCENGSVHGQTVLSSTSHHASVTYLHSETSLPLDNTNQPLSSLMDVHSSAGHFHSTPHQLDELSQLQPPGHSLPTDLTAGSGQKLPSIRTFRSSTRLLPTITREPSAQPEASSQPLHSLMPFSHHFQLNREHMSTGEHLDVHPTHSLPSTTTSSLGLTLTTAQFTSTSPYTTSALTSMTLSSTSSHDILTQSTPQAASLNVEVSDAVASFVNTLSPTSSREVDQNLVLYDTLPDKDTTFTDFFSSLELQYRVETDGSRPLGDDLQKTSPSNVTDHLKVGVDGKLDIDHNKDLHLANFINELAFSSDSDNILPSDTENLFDTSEDEASDVANIVPPPSHTGGKWFPGQKPVTPRQDPGITHTDKWNSIGKPAFSPGKLNILNSKMASGKMRTGLGKGKAMGGKWKPGEPPQNIYQDESEDEDRGELSDDEQELEEEEPQHAGRGKYISSGKVFPSGKSIAADKTYHCKPCKRTLLNKVSYERHCSTTGHIKRAKKQDESLPQDSNGKNSTEKQAKIEHIECTVCSKTFNNRYNFARHLVSSSHQHKALTGNKVMLLDEPYQLVLSRQSRFQCHICKFYCNTSEQLNVHVHSPGHAECVGSLVGPLLCVRCKFASRSNAEMLDHIEGEQHGRTIEESDRPCVLRESRYRVQCRSCDDTFHSATSLKKHMESTHLKETSKHAKKASVRGEGPPICPYCHKKWPSFANMYIHIRRKHTYEKPFRCEECDQGYAAKGGLSIHCQSKKHLDRLVQVGDMRPVDAGSTIQPKKKPTSKITHKCKMCDYVADKYTDLRPHFLQNHLDSVLECRTCGVKSVSQSAYNHHMNSKSHARTEKEAISRTATFTCNICGKKFYDSKKFVLHRIVHRHVLKNEKASLRRSCMSDVGISSKYKDFLASIQSTPLGQKVSCPVCKRNITKTQIYTHLRIHENLSPFGCIYCTQSYACPKSLQRHLAGHLGIKSQTCAVCQKKFPGERALVMHMKTEHSRKKKEFQCHLCSSSFFYKWKLRAHMSHHDKPVSCQHMGCVMRFSSQVKMLNHYRVHSGEKPFLCDQCGYASATKQQLNRHKRTHTGERLYQCEYCQYRAINSTNLGRHMRIHIGSKPYKCPYCPLTCNTLENLRKHVMKTKKHAGKPVYPCKVCNSYGTNSAAEFKQHLIKVHHVVSQSTDVLSEYAGLYVKSEDVKTLPEGARVIPNKDRNSLSTKMRKRRRSTKATANDHEYSLNSLTKQGCPKRNRKDAKRNSKVKAE